MTLDVLYFIDSKGGNAAEIRESQKKRGHSVEIVDEVIQMYADWVKSELHKHADHLAHSQPVYDTVDFEVSNINKEINAVQKQIGAKKKVRTCPTAVDWNIDVLYSQKKTQTILSYIRRLWMLRLRRSGRRRRSLRSPCDEKLALSAT
jgi:seryl-tRNA synthetase